MTKRQSLDRAIQTPRRRPKGKPLALWDSRFGIRDRPAPPASRSRCKDLSETLGQLQLFPDTAVQLAILRRFSIACHLVPNIYLTALSGLGHCSTPFSSSPLLIVALSHHPEIRNYPLHDHPSTPPHHLANGPFRLQPLLWRAISSMRSSERVPPSAQPLPVNHRVSSLPSSPSSHAHPIHPPPLGADLQKRRWCSCWLAVCWPARAGVLHCLLSCGRLRGG